MLNAGSRVVGYSHFERRLVKKVDGVMSWCGATVAGINSGAMRLGVCAYAIDHGRGIHPCIGTQRLEGEWL